jgi:cell division topological specificity factor
MSDWLSKLSGKKQSADQAKDRLKLVLIHDRTDIKPSTLEEMKDEIIKVISHHISIDPSLVKIQMIHDGREQRLVADIPIKPLR